MFHEYPNLSNVWLVPYLNIMSTSTLPINHSDRIARAALALEGLSVGDALGETCFRDDYFEAILDDPSATAAGPWPYTDDTAMALGIYEILHQHGRIDQDQLACRFAARFQAQPWRGYGPGAIRLLAQVIAGVDWRTASETIFPGGSFGNGSAMRIAPLSGYFAEDEYKLVAEQARLSAEITHAHPEGIAGGIAAAIAGAYAWRNRDRRSDAAVKRELFEIVLQNTPESQVREGVERAAKLGFDLTSEPDVKLLDHGTKTIPFDVSLIPVVKQLGNGSRISCQDTVPFCVWAAARHLDDYTAAIITTIRAGGDIDTNCAIVGGMVALSVGIDGIPASWRKDREELVI
jgi:ADP-ribosylglycohydrolase